VTGVAFLNNFHDLYALGKSLTPYGLADPGLGPTRDISGVPTIARSTLRAATSMSASTPLPAVPRHNARVPDPDDLHGLERSHQPASSSPVTGTGLRPLPGLSRKHHGWGEGTIGGQPGHVRRRMWHGAPKLPRV
jgi:hypothetical protein